MANRRDPSIQDIVRITESNLFQYAPRYKDQYDILAYVKGHNGHYYIVNEWRRCVVIRLYTKNQFHASDDLYFGLDKDEVLGADGKLTQEAKEKFIKVVTEHRPFHHVSKVVDRQQKTCYRWEADFGMKVIGTSQDLGYATAENTIKYVHIICKAEGMTQMPTIKFSKKGSCSWAKGDWALKFMQNHDGTVHVGTILHELAHIVDVHRGRRQAAEAGHGPKFIGLYIEFMVKYGKMDRQMLESTARQAGLQFSYDRVTSNNVRMAA